MYGPEADYQRKSKNCVAAVPENLAGLEKRTVLQNQARAALLHRRCWDRISYQSVAFPAHTHTVGLGKQCRDIHGNNRYHVQHRRMETEAKAKVVASIWGTEFIQFLTAQFFTRTILKSRMKSFFFFKLSWCNLSNSSNRPCAQ